MARRAREEERALPEEALRNAIEDAYKALRDNVGWRGLDDGVRDNYERAFASLRLAAASEVASEPRDSAEHDGA